MAYLSALWPVGRGLTFSAVGLVLGVGLAALVAGVTAAPVSVLLETTSLEMLQAMPAPMVPITVAVTNAVGVCPRGLTVGDTVGIDARGHLARPLCRTAVEALQESLLAPTEAPDFDRRVSCHCPVAGPGLTFAVRRAGAHDLG